MFEPVEGATFVTRDLDLIVRISGLLKIRGSIRRIGVPPRERAPAPNAKT
jgi:hypothetical protein